MTHGKYGVVKSCSGYAVALHYIDPNTNNICTDYLQTGILTVDEAGDVVDILNEARERREREEIAEAKSRIDAFIEEEGRS